MLWQKGWLETRFRLLLVAILAVLFLAPAFSGSLHGNAWIRFVAGSITALASVLASILAGAGILTQSDFAQKGMHGSTVYTLSLPVSRLRLFAVRAGLGWLLVAAGIAAACCAAWFLLPVLRDASSLGEMFRYAVVLLICASPIYALAALLSTFVDASWRTYILIFILFALWWLPDHTPLPRFANLIGAMTNDSPLLAHSLPWPAMLFSTALAAALSFAALRIAQTREY